MMDVKYDGGILVGFFCFVINDNSSFFLVNVIVGMDGSGDECGLFVVWFVL